MVSPKRHENETFEDFEQRRKLLNKVSKSRLRWAKFTLTPTKKQLEEQKKKQKSA